MCLLVQPSPRSQFLTGLAHVPEGWVLGHPWCPAHVRKGSLRTAEFNGHKSVGSVGAAWEPRDRLWLLPSGGFEGPRLKGGDRLLAWCVCLARGRGHGVVWQRLEGGG